MSYALSRISGQGGCEHVNNSDGAQSSKNYAMVVVQEDTVISAMTGSRDASSNTTPNLVTQMNISGKTLKQGAILTPPAGTVITDLTVSSGSVVAYKQSEQ